MSRENHESTTERKTIESRVSESRKVRKPLMEKKRRARINQSLNDLKRLLLETDSVKKEGSRQAKLEKADVLELTVTYVQKLHRQRGVLRGNATDDSTGRIFAHSPPSVDGSTKFKSGFNECARLVRDILSSQQSQKLDGDMQNKVFQHLEQYMNNLDTVLTLNRRSPSPSLQSDSCSSFDEKDTVLSSPGSFFYGASSSASSVSEEIMTSQRSHLRQSSLNQYERNGFESTSPMNTDTTSRWICNFDAVPLHNSPPVLIAHEVSRSPTQFVNNCSAWFNRGSTSDSVSNPSTPSPINNLAVVIPHYHPYDSTSLSASISHMETSRVWRPW